MYFNVNFNVFFKLIKVHLLVSELYVHQNARCNDKKAKHVIVKLRSIQKNNISLMGVRIYLCRIVVLFHTSLIQDSWPPHLGSIFNMSDVTYFQKQELKKSATVSCLTQTYTHCIVT